MSEETNDEIKVEQSKDVKPSTSGEVYFPNENKYSHIKNKQVRNQQYLKNKKERKKVCNKKFSLSTFLYIRFRNS